MSLDNRKVSQLIQQALDNNRSGSLKNSLEWAWREINSRRERGGSFCSDSELAAADHYLFLRKETFNYPILAGVFRIFIVGYDFFYKEYADVIRKTTGINPVFKTGKCPPSDFSPMIVMWGREGISDGLTDALKRPAGRLLAPKGFFPISIFKPF